MHRIQDCGSLRPGGLCSFALNSVQSRRYVQNCLAGMEVEKLCSVSLLDGSERTVWKGLVAGITCRSVRRD